MAQVIQFPKKSELSSDEQKILREHTIGDRKPGTLLHDFDVLLNFVGDGISVSAKNNLLPMNALTKLNSQMAVPIMTDLKRPAQRSFPHINGLYLLLRASGLTRIRGGGTKKLLITDEDALDSWKQLNPTERYFELLEAWLLRGSPEIIGEYGGTFFHEAIFKWDTLFKNIPGKGLKVRGNQEAESNITYFVGAYTVGILDLFGFVSVVSAKPEPGKGWQIDKIEKTPLGIAMLNLLSDKFFPKQEEMDNFAEFMAGRMEDEEAPVIDLQEIIRPFFPEWQNHLVLTEKEFEDGVCVFKVSLNNKIWRKIAISADSDLDQLSSMILTAFDFDFDHLYSFSYMNRFGHTIRIYHPYMEDEELCADEILIGELPLDPGSEIEYLYDFGDEWKFAVKLESVNPPNFKLKKPRVIESHGKSPEQYWNGEDESDFDRG